ncbi:hypothetical protein SDRG_04968 [Saprolegnia diclina VS20]|uniref:Uncharacterized protein n=1 Tax=Saprolegnia diclina (strain VS20) TaxID=1156394 RepID=T0QTE2_SAPDV|nr:hypothetical protein SDRG_04968 [Saprolegnia diclina VS20]EQC37951.1 hypothetical protein SDRG_04968 [Saprolegnia diclina VS20]|eukprot:XP_008608884.1 hypothetical protein SDRG_04968 [Saprolegnia diclina VS20]
MALCSALARAVRRPSRMRGFASMVKTTDPAITAQLAMFPELKESQDLIASSQPARAVPPLRRMLQVCESFSPALATETAWLLGQVLASLGETKDAIALFQKDAVHGKEQAIRVALLAGDVALARSLLSKPGAMSADNEALYLPLINWLGGHPIAATIASTEAYAKATEALLVLATHATMDKKSRKLTLDDDVASQVIGAWKAVVDDATTDDVLRAHMHANLGELYLLQAKYEDAMEALSYALKYQETQPALSLPLARTLVLLATGYHRLGKAVSAEGLFTTALETYERSKLQTSIESAAAAKAHMAYGDLLSQWERREAVGAKHLAAGQAQLGATPYLWSFVHLPL